MSLENVCLKMRLYDAEVAYSKAKSKMNWDEAQAKAEEMMNYCRRLHLDGLQAEANKILETAN